jgi:MFS family permease
MLATMKADMGLSVVAGLAVGGIIGVFLDISEVPAGSAIGTFVGGLVAALLLYAGRRRALIAGIVVGLFGFPIQLMIFLALVSSHLYTPPQVPEISQAVLLVALVATVLMQLVGGAVGGLLGSIIRHPPPGTAEAPRSNLPPPPPPTRPEKYCIQCGAGLAKETQICPACGAKQP